MPEVDDLTSQVIGSAASLDNDHVTLSHTGIGMVLPTDCADLPLHTYLPPSSIERHILS